jgi:hypothetical protein
MVEPSSTAIDKPPRMLDEWSSKDKWAFKYEDLDDKMVSQFIQGRCIIGKN